VFKKALKIAVSFCLLVGAYAGYTRLFAIVTYQLGIARNDVSVKFPLFESNSAKKAAELARESFPQGHWAAGKDLKLQYYEAVHGMYMYAQNQEILNDGKRIHVWPFAVIWFSGDGKKRQTATSDEAYIDLSQPIMATKPSNEPSKVLHITLIGDVRLRDDKGTLADTSDDLRIGPMTSVDFDDGTLQITSDSEIFLQDRDLTLTGIGMMIQLRRKGGSPETGGGASGFEAETADVWKDVHLVVNDVTSDGVLPGKSKPEKSGKTPVQVWSDRAMHVDLPKPRSPEFVGPPDPNAPPEPTFVKFKTNVRVIRGTDKTDQLNSDTLDLTLKPDPKPPKVAGADDEYYDEDEPAPSDGPMTELKIRVALARGDAVWLQSEAQGMVARCVELRYEKHAFENLPDITYLNGGHGKKLMVEKVEFDSKSPVPNTIKSIMRLTALDATIYESGGSNGSSKVIARGPGKTEERPARNASVARTAWFEDEMWMLTWHEGIDVAPTPNILAVRSLSQERPPIGRGTLRRLMTLTGVSKLVDHTTSTTLDARKSIVAEFQAEPNQPPLKGEGPAQIKWLDAFEDAHLTAPSKTLTARQFLKAKFEQPPSPPKPVAPAPVVPGAVAVAGPIVASATPPPTPTPAPTQPKPEADPQPVKAEPLVDGRADRVWACVQLGATGDASANSKGELKNAQLRGGVMVHQDPAPGKVLGSDASGEALDLTNQGNGLMKMVVKREEPQAFDPKTRLASASTKGRASPSYVPARVQTEGKNIESDDIIGLDQKIDFLWVQGAGVFTQLADKGLLDDKGIEGEKTPTRSAAKQAGPNTKDQLAISWNREMRFYGKSVDPEGRPAAKVEFRGESMEVRTADGKVEYRRGVEARMPDSAIYTDTMDVYMDRTIDFNKDSKKPAANPDEPKEPDAQIAMLHCIGQDIVKDSIVTNPGVDIQSLKYFPETRDLKEKQRIWGQDVIYDKRTGNFYAWGAGQVWIYRRKGKEAATDGPIPTAFPSNGPRRPEVVLTDKKLPPLELTKIKFTEGMGGRFGVAKEQAENERRDAEFFGAVQAVNASVLTGNSDIDFDRLTYWPDSVFLTSDVLNVYSFPNPPGSKAANRQLLDARGNALARSKFDTMQADRITYNSASSLMYAYGYDGKQVSLTKQDSPGQRPSSPTRGRTIVYNNVTRQSIVNDPQMMSFVDLKSGLRARAFFPDLGGTPKPIDPKPQPRQPLQRQGRQATERYGFTGH
jgi:hypothetical protein